MTRSQWHKIYAIAISAPPSTLFALVSDLPQYHDWLPNSSAFSATTDVDPYPVQLGSKYHDGKPGQAGKEWWGTVTGFQPPGSLDFHHAIDVRQLHATVDVHIHYCFEPAEGGTALTRWLVLDIAMPLMVRPMRWLVIRSFDRENIRTLAALKAHAEGGHVS